MANMRDFLFTVIQRIFSNWTALRMVVEHGLGPKERAIELCPYITNFIIAHENISRDILADELEDCMDGDFNTELEDDSAIEIADKLLQFLHYCREGNEELANIEMDKLPPLQSWILSRFEKRQRITNERLLNNLSSSDDEDETSDNLMDTAGSTASTWTKVRTRRKK